MFWYLSVEFLLNNSAPLGRKIFALSNPIRNSTYLALLIIITSLPYLRTRLTGPALLLVILLGGRDLITPALSNTLFTIHPPMLYVAVTLCAAHLRRGSRGSRFFPVGMLLLSMTLGGYWSMQELSWGGWWNWDVLECGVGYVWALIVLFSHRRLLASVSGSYLCSQAVILAGASYTALNKYGLGVSIHSFVSSRSARSHYPTLLSVLAAFSVVFLTRRARVTSLLALQLISGYLALRTCISFKPVLAYATALGVAYSSRGTRASVAQHRLMKFAALVLLTLNYANNPVFFMYTERHLSSQPFTDGFFGLRSWGRSEHILRWNGLWLSKPRYTASACLEVSASRSPANRMGVSAFFK